MNTSVDAEHPWPWLNAFDERDAAFFHGRQSDIDALLQCVESSPSTVLFGRSGLGKTSLLQAGLFPRLRVRRLLPVLVRLRYDRGRPSPMAVMAERIESERSAAGLRWRAEGTAAPVGQKDDALWLRLHGAPAGLEDARGQPWQLVLVLDQFEEIFTLAAADPSRQRAAFAALGDLIENRIPAGVAARLTADDDLFEGLDLDAQPFRVIVSLREDYLPDLEPWCDLIPRLGPHRYRLTAMDGPQAIDAVRLASGALVDAETAGQIVDYVAGRHGPANAAPPQVEPALLSLVCAGLNAERLQGGLATLDASNLGERGGRIIDQFYDQAIAGLPEKTIAFIENTLITPEGIRLSYPLASVQAGGALSDDTVELLIQRRLLRKEPGLGDERIELVHDRIAAVALRRRQRRLQEAEQLAREQAQEQARRNAERAAAAADAERQRAVAEAAEMRRRRNRLALAFALTAVFFVVSLAALVHASRRGTEAREAASVAQQKASEATLAQQAAEVALRAASAAEAAARDALGVAKAEGERASTEADRATQAERDALGELRASTALRLTVEARRFIQGDWPQGEARGWQMLLAAHALGRNSEIDGVLLAVLARSPNLAKVWDAGAPVVKVAVDSERGRALVATDDHALRLWDTKTGRPIGGPWLGHQGRITALALSQDGTRAVSAALDRTVRQWSLATGRAIGTPWPSPVVAALAYTNQDREVLGGLVSFRPLMRWNAADGAEIRERTQLPGMTGVIGIASGADGRELFMRAGLGGIRRMDAIRWERKGSDILVGSGNVQGPLAVSPDGSFVAIEGNTQLPVDVWQVADQRSSRLVAQEPPDDPANRRLVRPGDRVTALAFDGDGRRLIGAAADHTLRLWSTDNIEAPPQVWPGHADSVTGVEFVQDGALVLSAARDASLRLWTVEPSAGQRGVRSIKSFSYPVPAFKDGRLVVHHHMASVGLGAWPGGHRPIAEWPPETPKVLVSDADGRSWLVVTTDGRARAWREGRGWLVMPAIGPGVATGGLSANGQVAWLGRSEDRVEVVDLRRGAVLGTLRSYRSGKADGSAVALSNDGTRIAAVTERGMLRVGRTSPFNLEDAPLRRDAPLVAINQLDSSQEIERPTFSPDGRLLAAACGRDLTDLCVWDVERRQLLGRPWAGHRESITSLSFDQTGGYLLSGDARGALRLWEVERARQIGDAWPGHISAVRSIVFSADGLRVATTDDSAELRVWATPASAARDACALLVANMSEQQWKDWVSQRIPYVRACQGIPVAGDGGRP